MFLLFKNHVHVATAYSEEEADELYMKFECDEIIKYEGDE